MEQKEEYNGLWFSVNTPAQVRDVICKAYKENRRYELNPQRLRLFYGDKATGRVWMEEHDIIGYIGRSTGTQKIPLLIKTITSTGGGAILDHCIIGIKDAHTKQWLYKQENIIIPALRVSTSPKYTAPGLPFAVVLSGEGGDDEIQARFNSEERAIRWADFMQGYRMAK